MRCVVVVVLASVLVALGAASSARAHAVLIESRPANQAVVERSPDRVTLRFSEPVETSFGSVRVFDAGGSRVDSGQMSQPEADSVAVEIGRGLPRGTYTVAWRVISADSHPVHGAFVFSVGAASADAGGVAEQVLQEERTPRGISLAFAVARFLSLALLLACAGGALTLAVVFRGIDDRLRARLLAVLAGLAVALVPVTLAGIVLQGASAGGFGLGEALHWSVFTAVLDTRFGEVWMARAAIAAGMALLAFMVRRTRGAVGDVGTGLLAVPAGALALTPAASGHANVEGALAFLADVLHVLAASAWTGGLTFVVLALLLSGSGGRWPLAARIVPRFSVLAVVSVAVLVAAGVVNGYLEVRAWSGLWKTTYGRLVLAKVAILLPLLALGAYNNRFAVPRLKRQIASVVEQRRFLLTAGAELALFIGVLGVTAALVAEPPAKAYVAPSGPYATTTQVGPFELNLVVDPAKAGRNLIHLYLLGRSGQPAAEVAEATLSASLPDRNIGPLRLDSRPAGPGHYSVPTAVFPIPGDWKLDVAVRRGEFDQWTTSLSIPIRKG